MSWLTALSLPVVAALGWFSLRRLVFLVGALVPAGQIEDQGARARSHGRCPRP